MTDSDLAVRIAAFAWLTDMTRVHGDVFPRTLLEKGFEYQGVPIPLVAPKGIFKPKSLQIPLSITTAPKGPYDDAFDSRGFLRYRYRGTDPQHPDNLGLRLAMQQQRPLAYFHGVVPGKYLAVWPVFVIGDDPAGMAFTVAVDEVASVKADMPMQVAESSEIRRAYITSAVRVRLHQRSFREKVLDEYRSQCSLCNLRHTELLDAAHIIPDSDPGGVASIPNGIALCKLHHAAFDSLLLAITPDYIIQVRADVLGESDGPMLQHGLKDLHQKKIILPHQKGNWPDQALLDLRFQEFKKAA